MGGGIGNFGAGDKGKLTLGCPLARSANDLGTAEVSPRESLGSEMLLSTRSPLAPGGFPRQ